MTESQRRVGKYFLVVALVLLLQIAAGAIMAHACYDRGSFYGIELQNVLPFNFLRDVHIQAPIVWIGVAWIGAGLFLAPAMAGGRDASGQPWLVDLLFWATLVVVAGALVGNWLGVMGYIQSGWFWFGNRGLSYIQLGRFWQIGFFLGLLIWSGLVFRALWPTAAELWRATRKRDGPGLQARGLERTARRAVLGLDVLAQHRNRCAAHRSHEVTRGP